MSYSAAHGGTRKGVVTAPRAALAHRLLLSLVVLALLRAGGACAGDLAVAATETQLGLASRQTSSTAALPEFTKHYILSDPLLTAPREYGLREIPETKSYSATDFRPRGRSIFDSDARLSVPVDNLGSTKNKDLMERLREYRLSRDHYRVLTLWDSGASNVSIQTDRKGDPQLQWTSHLFNHGGTTHGLLDQLFPVSVFGGTTHITRSASSQPSRVSGALSVLHFGSAPPP